jgi:hypothetical protein
MSGRGFVDFFVIFRKPISPDGQTPYTQQCLLNQASPVKNKSYHLNKTIFCHHVLSVSRVVFHSVVSPLSCDIDPCNLIVHQLQGQYCSPVYFVGTPILLRRT